MGKKRNSTPKRTKHVRVARPVAVIDAMVHEELTPVAEQVADVVEQPYSGEPPVVQE